MRVQMEEMSSIVPLSDSTKTDTDKYSVRARSSPDAS